MPRGGADVTITANESPTTVSEVILGIDTHKDVHVAVALNQLGRRLGELTVPTTTKGYEKLLRWAEGFAAPCATPVWKVRAAMGPDSLAS
jgi:hypothetical protein